MARKRGEHFSTLRRFDRCTARLAATDREQKI